MATRKQSVPEPIGAAAKSALAALQAELDDERVAHAQTRARSGREVEAMRARVVELEAELAGSAARLRELAAQLQARGR